MSFAPENESLAKPETLLRVPVGLASPLWSLFAGAAVSGAAWWWMTRWAGPQNLEAMFGDGEATVAPEMAALAAPAIEVIEAGEAALDAVIEPDTAELAAATVEAAEATEAAIEPAAEVLETAMEAVVEMISEVAPEPALEPLVEAASEPVAETAATMSEPEAVAEALLDPPSALEAVGGESAPLSPVVEALTPEIADDPAPSPKPKKKTAPKAP